MYGVFWWWVKSDTRWLESASCCQLCAVVPTTVCLQIYIIILYIYIYILYIIYTVYIIHIYLRTRRKMDYCAASASAGACHFGADFASASVPSSQGSMSLLPEPSAEAQVPWFSKFSYGFLATVVEFRQVSQYWVHSNHSRVYLYYVFLRSMFASGVWENPSGFEWTKASVVEWCL